MRANTLITLRPRTSAHCLSRGRTVLLTEPDGFINGGDAGLFVHETRLLSRYRILINGKPPAPNALSTVQQHTWLGYYILPAPGVKVIEDTGSGHVPATAENTLEVRVTRSVGEGLHEDIDLTNYSCAPAEFQLAIDWDGDFADLAEVRQTRQQFGTRAMEWSRLEPGVWRYELTYRARHRYDHQGETGTASIERGLIIEVRPERGEFERQRRGIRFPLALPPGGTWQLCLRMAARIDGVLLEPPSRCHAVSPTRSDGSTFLLETTQFSTRDSGTLSHVVVGALDRAVHDLDALRLTDRTRREPAWTVAAGLPMYVALFGRDVLTAGWQAALTGPELMRGALDELVHWQGTMDNAWRDEEPGRMLHEAHTGPLEQLNFNPRARSYSSITTSAFFPVVVAELWHWTGNRELVSRFVPAALAGLKWLDERSDRDGDGFHDYRTRSIDGVRNQAWKDSGDAIVHEDGSLAETPIATCEEQGFAYAAKYLLAEVLWWLGRRDEAKGLFHEARELKARFNERFWLDDLGFLALGIDRDGRQIRSITSNPGHCLATGILESDRARTVADRLLADDLFSGWGVRTLSNRHPAYNPFSYHRGSVWPVEQGTFAVGCTRYGFHDQTERLCRAMFEATSLFDCYRLPELFSGHSRDEDHPFPAFYPQANSPQAWSASVVFTLVQSMLGLYPYAPLHLLIVDPHLPAWLPELTLTNLRVGEAVATIRFFRKPDGSTDYRVRDTRGPLHVIRQPSPWSLTASLGERLGDVLMSLLPGH